jgi:hypothetical protein
MGDEFSVDPPALRAAAGQLDEHAGEVATHGETLGANTAGTVGRGAIGEVVESAVKRGIGIVAHDISAAVRKFYADAAVVMRKAAAETERRDAEAKQAFDELGHGPPSDPGSTRSAHQHAVLTKDEGTVHSEPAARDFFGGRGSFGGRQFDPDQAGGPIVRLDYTKVQVTPRGIDVVESHLQRFVGDGQVEPAEAGMLSRLRLISNGNVVPTDYDLRFYSHELRESVRYRRMGFQTGQPADPDEAYELWNNVHTATLADYNIDERSHPLYYPGLLSR